MSGSEPGAAGDERASGVAELRRRLHDANGRLSNAVLQLSLLLEDTSLEPSRRLELELALEACRAAADDLRAVWTLIPGR